MNYNSNMARVSHHEAQLKIIPFSPEKATRKIISETWRSGGGVIAHSTNRPTLVLRVIDSEYSGMMPVSRRGQMLD